MTRSSGPLKKAARFGRAVVRHTADGFRKLTDEEYEQRIAVCRECPACDVERLVCRDVKCGCFLTRKARWHSESCPRNRWPEV